MWEPEPGWQVVPGGVGASSLGVWRTTRDGHPVVVKRLLRPAAHEPHELVEPAHFAYWRRAAEVALTGAVAQTPGLRGAPVVAVEEDAHGITLVHEEVTDDPANGLFVARNLGRFAGADLPDAPWLVRDQLPDRLRRVERRGGWRALARTSLADVADHLWTRRQVMLRRLAGLPTVPQHGDPVPANLPGRLGPDVVAVDWGSLGRGPVGADLGYYALSARESFEPLLDAYCAGLPTGLADFGQVELGARISAVYTVIGRADWALARVAGGEGALAGKFRHPGVAPYLRAMQRQFPQIEALLD